MNTQEGTKLNIPALRDRARVLEPVLRVGKNGLTEGALEEIAFQLKKKRLVKIKFLKAFLEGKDKKSVAKELAERTGAVLVQQVGFVVVLYKPADRRLPQSF